MTAEDIGHRVGRWAKLAVDMEADPLCLIVLRPNSGHQVSAISGDMPHSLLAAVLYQAAQEVAQLAETEP